MGHDERDAAPALKRDGSFAWAVAVGGAAILLGVPILDPVLVRERLWAFDHLRDLSLAARAVLAALLLAAASRQAQDRAVALAGRLRQGAARFTPRRAVALPAIGLVCLGLFWGLRQRNLELGDSALLVQLLTRYVHLDGFHVTYDEPLDLYLHSVVYRLLHDWFDGSVEDAYVLLSCLAGVIFVAVQLALWRRLAPAGGRRAVALALVGSTASIQLFFGYVENYTLVAAAMMLYALLALRHLRGQGGLFAPALALGFGLCLHVLAGWLLPSLVYLALAGRGRDRAPWERVASLMRAAAGVAVPVVATIGYLTALGFPLSSLGRTHLAHLKFVFFTQPGTPQFRFAAFSPEHWIAQGNQLLLTALPALLALAWVALLSRASIDRRDGWLRFLAVATICLQLFASTWNPELGAYVDWDLFAAAGFFYALLAAWTLVGFDHGVRRVRRVALPIVALSVALTGSWVTSNARRVVEVDPLHDSAHLLAGQRHANGGRNARALHEFEEALRINPSNGEVVIALAATLWRSGERERAVRQLERYLEVEPAGPHASQVRRTLARLRGAPGGS